MRKIASSIHPPNSSPVRVHACARMCACVGAFCSGCVMMMLVDESPRLHHVTSWITAPLLHAHTASRAVLSAPHPLPSLCPPSPPQRALSLFGLVLVQRFAVHFQTWTEALQPWARLLGRPQSTAPLAWLLSTTASYIPSPCHSLHLWDWNQKTFNKLFKMNSHTVFLCLHWRCILITESNLVYHLAFFFFSFFYQNAALTCVWFLKNVLMFHKKVKIRKFRQDDKIPHV